MVQAEIHGRWIAMTKAAQKIPADTRLKTGDLDELRYVSRAGLKLELALRQMVEAQLIPEVATALRDATILDIGQSTGGFTDCLLQYAVRQAVGVDVGHGQLAEKLRADPRVICLEGINARELPAATLFSHCREGFDWVVMDVSFISQTLILPGVPAVLKNGGYLLSLVKPQFEVGAKNIAKGGLVRDAGLYEQVREKVTACAVAAGLRLLAYIESALDGGDGNREFFMLCQKP